MVVATVIIAKMSTRRLNTEKYRVAACSLYFQLRSLTNFCLVAGFSPGTICVGVISGGEWEEPLSPVLTHLLITASPRIPFICFDGSYF